MFSSAIFLSAQTRTGGGGGASLGGSQTFTGINTFSQQIISSLATGTAPFSIASTTTVANLTVSNHPQVQFCGTTVACAGTAQTSVKIAYGTAPLTSGTPSTATLTGLPFTSSATYVCSGTDQTTATNNLIKFANASGSSTVITGPATITDSIGYVCVGT